MHTSFTSELAIFDIDGKGEGNPITNLSERYKLQLRHENRSLRHVYIQRHHTNHITNVKTILDISKNTTEPTALGKASEACSKNTVIEMQLTNEGRLCTVVCDVKAAHEQSKI